mmetsp:Transcript_42568/g.59639  ORF Transcript_42568/g.59639 Transcript_42568/m.59639 type:complete len:585 (+) Transcript_42568:1251-3005(+)
MAELFTPPKNSKSPAKVFKARYSEEEAALIIQRAVRLFLAKKTYARRSRGQKSRLNIVQEIVSTEATYVKTLETIVNHFLLPLRALSSQGKPVVDDEEIKTIFSSVEVILGFSNHLLQRLNERFAEWKNLPPGKQQMGDIFLEMISYTKVYISYVTNYETAAALCSQLRKKSERFEKWEQESFSSLPGNHTTMAVLLVTPVQRIPRYLLLIEELLKATWEGHVDVPPLTEALCAIKEIAILVDKRTAEMERVQKISEIEDQIGGKFETLREANRRYVMEGELGVVTEGKGKFIKSLRYFFLFNDLLVVCKYAKAGSLRGSLRGSKKGKAKKTTVLFEYRSRAWLAMPEKLGSIIEKSDFDGLFNIFELNLPTAKFLLSAGSDAIKKKWLEALRECFHVLEPKYQFKNDVAQKMSTEKAKRARALIAQQYLPKDDPEDSEKPAVAQRKFRTHRENFTDMKRMENAQKAEEHLERHSKTQRVPPKNKSDVAAFRTRASSSCETFSSSEDGIAERKSSRKKKRTLNLGDEKALSLTNLNGAEVASSSSSPSSSPSHSPSSSPLAKEKKRKKRETRSQLQGESSIPEE